MQYPTTLKIGAHTYELVFKSHWEGSDEELAYTRYEIPEIVINSELPPSRMFSVFLHEGLHVMNPQLSHDLLASLAEQTAQLLIDNGFIRP